MKQLITFILFCITLFMAKPVLADSYVAESSASLKNTYKSGIDLRVGVLKSYLIQKKSPLADYAVDFVYFADKYSLDWRLVPAITGVESSFGKRIPYNSFNAYGWANGDYKFESWPSSIEHVTKTLKLKYVDRGLVSIEQIARVYAPPSSTWASKVRFFMKDIDPLGVDYSLN